MAEVVTLVTGVVPEEPVEDLAEAYRQGAGAGLPPAVEETLLLREEGGSVAVLTVWRSRADLEAMLASGEEPFAPRLIRMAGGSPEVAIHRVLHHAADR